MNSRASAAGTFLLFGDLMILRIFSPSGVDPGSLTRSVLCPSFSKRCSSSLAWVVLPAPSPPSKEMNGAACLDFRGTE